MGSGAGVPLGAGGGIGCWPATPFPVASGMSAGPVVSFEAGGWPGAGFVAPLGAGGVAGCWPVAPSIVGRGMTSGIITALKTGGTSGAGAGFRIGGLVQDGRASSRLQAITLAMWFVNFTKRPVCILAILSH